jgi:putative peptidoglycan lipid II flippase
MDTGRQRFVQVSLTGTLLVLSMVFGLIGQALIAYYFGAGDNSDALFLARDASDLAAKLLLAAQGAGVLVPLLVAVRARRGTVVADRALSAILSLVLLSGVALVGLLELLAAVIVPLLAPGFDDASSDVAVRLLRIVAPMAPLIVVSALAVAALQARGRFGRAMGVNVAGGVALVALTPLLVSAWGIQGAAAGMLAGGLAQAVAAWALLAAEGMPLVVAPWRAREEVVEFLRRTVPFLSYAAASQGSGVVLRIALSTLATGLYAAYSLSSRLFRSALTLMLTPIQQVLLPALAHSEAGSQRKAADAELVATLRYAVFLLLPVSVGLVTLSGPTVSLIFERGRFDASDSHHTAVGLAVLALAVVPTATYTLLEQAAYSRGHSGLIVRVNIALEAVQAALYLPLAAILGLGGVAFASVVAVVLATTIYVVVLRPGRATRTDHGRYALGLAACSVAMLAAIELVSYGVRSWLAPGPGLAQIKLLAPAILAGAAAYLAAAGALRLREPRRLAELTLDVGRAAGSRTRRKVTTTLGDDPGSELGPRG